MTIQSSLSSLGLKLALLLSGTFVLSACDESVSTNLQLADQGVNPTYLVDESLSQANISNQALAVSHLSEAEQYLTTGEVYNPEAVIPPQCYTKTEGTNNPCYVCHQSYSAKELRPNAMNDGLIQGAYIFSDVGVTNSWKNLFVDRTELIKSISDEEIMEYVNQDNYGLLEEQMKSSSWTNNIPYIKDLELGQEAFDEDGLAKDGSHWVAYNYKPFPSTFWPTNGSTGDAMIRLGEAYRSINGEFSKDVYFANLALVEMAMKDIDSLSTSTIDENKVGIDLNNDGHLTQIKQIKKQSHYVGDASDKPLTKMLFPEQTELLHTVRYLGVDENGETVIPKRMKEVRYMHKHMLRSRESLLSSYYAERKEKHFEKLPRMVPAGDRGIANGYGWTINGLIEDKQGQLRPQHQQELAFCNGCHRSVGSTIDQTFSFARKVEGKDGWGYINLKSIKDVPSLGDKDGEFVTYLERVKGGDEFRQNQEMLAKWFTPNGKLNKEKVNALNNIHELITPSKERALKLNKAYRTIVAEQSYLFGRDVTLVEAKNVLKEVDESAVPINEAQRYVYDLRLNWEQ
ncbi:hypothetical protein J1N51_12700 [Psychrosphaera ytuae]|uniref:Lipoprotein n=1 Tax=Psychrosphaera ytuae TaxID=2820710 RepID=A0A975HHW0_9GAMM|nr:hypothetical protein [Psychrosphaera ytuae]QTH63570.1 hypothetical protein J1N51_12700 [Psychrosphaera ytuae]